MSAEQRYGILRKARDEILAKQPGKRDEFNKANAEATKQAEAQRNAAATASTTTSAAASAAAVPQLQVGQRSDDGVRPILPSTGICSTGPENKTASGIR